MNERQINCSCGASWLIWENISEIVNVDNYDFKVIELRVYKCPKCGKEIPVTIGFRKEIKKIKYE